MGNDVYYIGRDGVWRLRVGGGPPERVPFSVSVDPAEGKPRE
jgi:hypothetical protein